MIFLPIKSKTGFSAISPFKIYDENGKLFYSDEFTNRIRKGFRLFFNLPKGEYNLTGRIVKLRRPVKQKKIKLPPNERNYPKQKLRIEFGVNPNKATVFWENKVILFDNSFLDVPKYMLFDIYFHELGHRYYKTEFLADRYATKRMLEVGFNKSQIGTSVLNTLGDNNYQRKFYKLESLRS